MNVCHDCGLENLERCIDKDGVSTWHVGECGICKQIKPVTVGRLFGIYEEIAMTHEAWKLTGGYDDTQRLEMKREADDELRKELQDELDRDKCGYPSLNEDDDNE